MIDMTRESYCKDEWFHFEKCLGEHTDLKQIGTNVWKNLEKMKGRDPRTVDRFSVRIKHSSSF